MCHCLRAFLAFESWLCLCLRAFLACESWISPSHPAAVREGPCSHRLAPRRPLGRRIHDPRNP